MFTFKVRGRSCLAVGSLRERAGAAERDGFRWHMFLLPAGEEIQELILTDEEMGRRDDCPKEGEAHTACITRWVEEQLDAQGHCGSPRCTFPGSLHCRGPV